MPTQPWTTRISNGAAFLSPLTDTELRATPVPVSASALPLPTVSIDDAQMDIAAAGTLRISHASTGGDFPGAELYVQALHVA